MAHAHYERCKTWVSRSFAGYFGVQFASAGALHMERGGNLERLALPALWFTGPVGAWRYGVPPGYDEEWEHRFVTFRGPRVARWLEGGLLPRPQPGVFQVPKDGAAFAKAFDGLLASLEAGEHERGVYLLEGLLLEAAKSSASCAQGPGGRLQELMARLSQRSEDEVDFVQEARRLGLSYSHFRSLFRREAGSAPRQYLLSARLVKAAALLRREGGEVAAVAARCGFEDSAYFNRLFKRAYGMPPGRYRAEAGLGGDGA